MDLLKSYLSSENLVKYTVIEMSVITAQQLATKGHNGKKGWRYWLRLTTGTTLGLVGGIYLGDAAAEYVSSNGNTVSAPSTASVSSAKKTSDTM